LMASSSCSAGISDYDTLSNATAQTSRPNTGALKNPTMEQVARLPPVQNDSGSTVNGIFTLLGAACLIPWNGNSPFCDNLAPFLIRNAIQRMGDSPLKNTYASSFVVLYQFARWPTLIHATLTTSSVRSCPLGINDMKVN